HGLNVVPDDVSLIVPSMTSRHPSARETMSSIVFWKSPGQQFFRSSQKNLKMILQE
ncbi:hypothetical protein BgiBS90_003660, partial [Biomphalaria glabrata]